MMSNQMPKIGSILTGVLAFITMLLYVSLLTYLTLKREKSAASSPADLAMESINRTSGSRDERGSDLRSNVQRTNEFESDHIIRA